MGPGLPQGPALDGLGVGTLPPWTRAPIPQLPQVWLAPVEEHPIPDSQVGAR